MSVNVMVNFLHYYLVSLRKSLLSRTGLGFAASLTLVGYALV